MGERDKLRQYQETIRKVISAFQGVDFPIVVESTLGVDVEAFNAADSHDQALLSDLTAVADSLSQTYFSQPVDRAIYQQITGRVPFNFRPNEVGIALEHAFPALVTQMAKDSRLTAIRSVRHLTAHGYPDSELEDVWDRTTYVEIKTTTRPDEGSARDFFFTPLSATRQKVKHTARHLLLGFVIEEVETQRFRTIGWKLADLYRIKLSLKPEFNADNLEIYKQDALLAQRTLK